LPEALESVLNRRIVAYWWIGAVIALLAAPRAAGFTEIRQLGTLSVTIYAPDWVWQKRDINILLIARNPSDLPVDWSVRLEFPEGEADHFDYAGTKEKSVHVPSLDTARTSFAGIVARDSVPTQTYDFRVYFTDGTNELSLTYPVRTVRGAAVSGGNWALYLPVGIALLWCLVFAVALRIMAAPGAWRQIPPSLLRLAETPEGAVDVPDTSKDT